MPVCCPDLRNLCNQTCEKMETGVSRLFIGCISDFNFGIVGDEITSLTLTEDLTPVGDPPVAPDPTTGLVEFCFEGEELAGVETGTYDRATGKSTWEDTTEGLKIYSATTADDETVRGLLGKQIWLVRKLKNKSGNYVFRSMGIGGGLRCVNVRRSDLGPYWEIDFAGNSEQRQLYILLGGSAATTETALLNLLLP